MSEGSAKEGPVTLQVVVQTPTDGRVKTQIGLDATVGSFVTRTMRALGVDHAASHDLQVPLKNSNGEHYTWHTVDPDETLLDALRGTRRAPKIVYEQEEPIDGRYKQ